MTRSIHYLATTKTFLFFLLFSYNKHWRLLIFTLPFNKPDPVFCAVLSKMQLGPEQLSQFFSPSRLSSAKRISSPLSYIQSQEYSKDSPLTSLQRWFIIL